MIVLIIMSTQCRTQNGTFVKGNFSIGDEWRGLKQNDLERVATLGQGSSGIVYKAIHRPSQKVLALKDISVFDEEKRNQIVKELQALYVSNCPHLVGFFGAFYTDGSILIALEMMDGGSLADIYNVFGKIPESVMSVIVLQVLLGLKYLHKDRHLVHRDIKPSNLLMNEKGEFKITDFGVSSELDNTMEECATFVGTVPYMSPERLVGERYSFASDIWGLGICVLECVTGTYPFMKDGVPARGFWEIMNCIKTRPPPRLEPNQGYSPELCDFIARCLMKEPKQRADVTELLQHPFSRKYQGKDFGYEKWVQTVVRMIYEDRKHKEQDPNLNPQNNSVERGLASLIL
jgi:serine/threonine protein kinase